MNKVLKADLWLNRTVSLFVLFLFTFIVFKNILHPAETTAASGILLNSAGAFSVVRVGMGTISAWLCHDTLNGEEPNQEEPQLQQFYSHF